MKKILLSIAATAALAGAAVPAAAQPWNDYGRSYGARYDMSYVDGLDWRLQNAAQERRISWGEARALRNQLAQVKPMAWRVLNGQASPWERQRVEQTVRRIEQAVGGRGYADNRRRGDRYDDGYGRGDDRYDRDWRR